MYPFSSASRFVHEPTQITCRYSRLHEGSEPITISAPESASPASLSFPLRSCGLSAERRASMSTARHPVHARAFDHRRSRAMLLVS